MKSIRETRGDALVGIVNGILLTCVLCVILFPLLHIVASSFSDPRLVSTGQVWLVPKAVNLGGYQRVLSDPDIMTGYRNTIFYTVCGTLINLAVTLLAAYAVSRPTLPGRKALMFLMVLTMYFQGGMIPTYIIVRDLGLRDTWWVLLLINAVSVYNLIIARTFFSNGVPRDLEEAAYIDGCSMARSFFVIVLPLSKALIGVLALYYGIMHWNAWFSAMIYLTDNRKVPLQLVLRRILVESQMLMADSMLEDSQGDLVRQAQLIKYCAIVVSSVPVMVIYPFLQKFFNQGVMLGSIKG